MLWNFIIGLYIILAQQIQPNSRTELYLNELFEDALESYDYKVYSLVLPNKEMIMNKTLIITLIPYVGNPKLAVDCDEQPKLMDYYEWQAQKYFMQQLSITAKEREALNCSGQLFYIGVSTEVPTGYIINSYILSGQLALYFNIPVNGELVPDEVINYQIQPEGITSEITIQIFADKSVVTYLKQCNSTQCNVALEDMKQNTDTGVLIKDPQFSFIHKEENCKQCHYILALHSTKKAQYRILTKHNETHTLLREGITDQSYVNEGFYNYYTFQIPNDTSIRYVKFQLTSYIGNVTMYSSDDLKQPNDLAYQQTSSSKIVISSITNSTIYLSVYGNEYSYYGLYTSISRTDELSDQNFITLENGVPQQFDQDKEFSFFKIQLDLAQNISINLIPLKGDLMMFIKSSNSINLEIPDSNSFQWKSDRQIIINTDDPNYSMIYYIGVEKYNTDEAQFSIQYSLKGDIFQYKIGEQIIGTTQSDSLNYYKVPMVAEDLIITKEVYSHTDINELQVYISVNQSNTHPSSQNYDYVLSTQSLTIPNSKLQCSKQQQQQQQQSAAHLNERITCYVYFSVGSQNVNFYSISTKSNNTLVKLFEGLPQTFPMVKTTFYYELQDQELSVQCYNSESQYFRLHGWFGTPEKQFKDFSPSNNNFYFQSLTIPSNQNESRVYFSVTPYNENSNFTFTIGIYEELVFLTESDPVVDQLDGGMFKYYRINVIEADSILIQVSQAGAGYFRIVVSKGIDSRPDFNQADHTTFLDSNHIIIEKDQTPLNGDYIVGVFSYKDTEIQIAYTSGQFRLFNMYFATPFNVYLPPNEPYYYIIKSQLPLKIIVANIAGDLNVKVKQYNGNDYKEAIQSNNTLVSQSVERQAVLYTKKCGENCSYLIELISRQDNAHAVLEVIGDNEIITLHNSMMWRDILKEDEVAMFKLGAYGKQQLLVTLISGEIRVLIKEGSQIDHDDEATSNTRVKEDTAIDIPENSTYFHYNYIKVIGISETSVYTIVPILKDYMSTEIYYGQTRAGTLQPNESIFYHFRSFVQVEDKFAILTVITKNTSINNLYLDVSHSDIEPITQINTFKRAAVIRMYDQLGLYQIQLRANELPMHYQLSLIDDKTNILIDDVPFYNAANINEYQIYQIFVEERSQILLEAYSCQGTILIQGTRSLENLEQQIFEIQLTEGSQTHIQEIIKCEAGIYYFMVEIISTGQLNQTAYYIKQQSFEHTEVIPYSVFKQSGEIYWGINGNQLRLQIPNFISQNSQISFKEVTYIFRLDAKMEDETLQCIFDEHYLSENNTQSSDPYTYIFLQDNLKEYTEILIDLVDDKFLYLSGMAKILIVNDDNEIEELTYSLDRIHLDYTKQEMNKSFNWWNCIVISFFILFLIVMSVLLYKKTQIPIHAQQDNTQIELNYQNFS